MLNIMNNQIQIKVWDPVVRFFHWSLVSAFAIAYITEGDFLSIHSWAGYFILGLLSIRIIWGFIGSSYARFKDFIYSPALIKQYLKDILALKAKRYIGHNPAGGAMVILLLISLLMATSSGVLLYGAAEQAGPLGGWFSETGGMLPDILEEIHEFFANFTLFLVCLHIAGVVFESLLHKENLVSSMISGFKSKN